MLHHTVEQKIRGRGIGFGDVRDVASSGKAVEKDLPPHPERKAGIAFEKTLRSGRRIKAKIGYARRRYAVVTAHDA